MFELDIRCHLIKIIQSMITNRTLTVRLGGFSTVPCEMVAGVAQGSVLGPIWFNYYMHDIPSHGIRKNFQFADDTYSYVTHDRWLSMFSPHHCVKTSLLVHTPWMSTWQVLVNFAAIQNCVWMKKCLSLSMSWVWLAIPPQDLGRALDSSFRIIVFGKSYLVWAEDHFLLKGVDSGVERCSFCWNVFILEIDCQVGWYWCFDRTYTIKYRRLRFFVKTNIGNNIDL